MHPPSTRRLADFFPDAPSNAGGLPISDLVADSRLITPGAAFVALPGTKADGAAFIADAAARGAAAIVAEGDRPPSLPPAVAYLRVPDARRALALAAARFHPGQPDTIVAVTGTSGKSSVAEFVRQLFAALGRESASLGTLGVVRSGEAAYGSLTTPDPVTLHRTLDELARAGVTHLAMEASSHGLQQRRLDGVRLAAAAFTNLGRDHLDYHPTVEDYLAAKLRLFDELLQPDRPVVVNTDGAEADRVAAAAGRRGLPLVTVGHAGETIRLLHARRHGFSQALTLRFAAGASRDAHELSVELPLVGAFQVENALVAAGLVLAVLPETKPQALAAAMSRLHGVPGRLERVGEVGGALAIVDYAHKPDALQQVLAALRPFATGRLHLVFGCGGDRDRGKRALMGAIAVAGADAVTVTDDNPRSEDPAAIRAAILAAAPGACEIGDRREAIGGAVRELRPGDVLVVAGKGHETGQIVGDRTLPFSDSDELRAAMAERSR